MDLHPTCIISTETKMLAQAFTLLTHCYLSEKCLSIRETRFLPFFQKLIQRKTEDLEKHDQEAPKLRKQTLCRKQSTSDKLSYISSFVLEHDVGH